MISHDDQPRLPVSHLFVLRLWQANTDDDQTEWRGKLHHVLSGESRYFKDWHALVACLCVMLSEQQSEHPGGDDDQREVDPAYRRD